MYQHSVLQMSDMHLQTTATCICMALMRYAGGAIFGIVLAGLIFLTAIALTGFLVQSKRKQSYVR